MMPVCSALIPRGQGNKDGATFLEIRLCELISFSGDTLCFAPYFPGKLSCRTLTGILQNSWEIAKGQED